MNLFSLVLDLTESHPAASLAILFAGAFGTVLVALVVS